MQEQTKKTVNAAIVVLIFITVAVIVVLAARTGGL